jgi:hypothetical protein
MKSGRSASQKQKAISRKGAKKRKGRKEKLQRL